MRMHVFVCRCFLSVVSIFMYLQTVVPIFQQAQHIYLYLCPFAFGEQVLPCLLVPRDTVQYHLCCGCRAV